MTKKELMKSFFIDTDLLNPVNREHRTVIHHDERPNPFTCSSVVSF